MNVTTSTDHNSTDLNTTDHNTTGDGGANSRTPAVDPGRLSLMTATVLSGLSAGFFFTYEASVTLGLARVGDVAYVETFQAINETIRNPSFGLVFFGSIPAIAAAAAINWNRSTAARLFLGSGFVLYLVTVLLTRFGNVPLNNELAEVVEITPAAASAARAAFEDEWNRLNLIRTATAIGSFGSLVLAQVMCAAARIKTQPPVSR